MAPSVLQRACLASLFVTLAPASLQASHTRAASFHHATAAFIAAPPSRHGDGSPIVGSGSADQLSRLLLEDGLYKGRQPHQQRQPRRDKATAAASTAAATQLYGNSNSAGRQRHKAAPQTWAKVHWTPPRPPSYGSGVSRRQRTTRLSWSKGQWSRDRAPTMTARLTRPTASAAAAAAAAPPPPAPPVSAFQPQEVTKPRLGGVRGGAGAGVSGVGGGALTRLSASFAPAAVSEPSRPPPPPLATAPRIRQQQDQQPPRTVSRPAVVSSATIGSTGPKDLSGAPVEVISTAERYFEVIKENAEEDKIVVIKIYAGFCRACKAFDRKFRLLSLDFEEQGANVKFFEMDWMKTRELCKALQVKKLPHMELYVGERGRLESFVCGPSKSALLKEKLDKLIADPSDPSLGEAPIPDPDDIESPTPKDSASI